MKNLLILTIMVSIVVFLSLTLYRELDQRKVLAEQTENFGVSQVEYFPEPEVLENYQYLPLDICYQETCYRIEEDVIETFYNEEKVDKNALYIYLLENVESFFDQLSGDRITVENRAGSFISWKNDYIISRSRIYPDIKEILELRLEGDYVTQYQLLIEDLPGTNGTYAEKYIEVDHSKQKLYVWVDEKVVRTISLSGAKSDFEVYGVFPIIDKGSEPIAPGGKYMPYWMAFYYSPRQDSWYGLHALIWWYDEAGNKVFESTNHIGVRRSRGCIRMLLEDAKFLYENFEKGDPILIHQ